VKAMLESRKQLADTMKILLPVLGDACSFISRCRELNTPAEGNNTPSNLFPLSQALAAEDINKILMDLGRGQINISTVLPRVNKLRSLFSELEDAHNRYSLLIPEDQGGFSVGAALNLLHKQMDFAHRLSAVFGTQNQGIPLDTSLPEIGIKVGTEIGCLERRIELLGSIKSILEERLDKQTQQKIFQTIKRHSGSKALPLSIDDLQNVLTALEGISLPEEKPAQ
jgi:hypothetical protein